MNLPTRYTEISRSTGRPLSEINPGSDERALPAVAALEAINALAGSSVAVLGGDVLVSDNRGLRYASANWHSKRRSQEPARAFAERSQREAREYIENYKQGAQVEPLFVLVVDQAR